MLIFQIFIAITSIRCCIFKTNARSKRREKWKQKKHNIRNRSTLKNILVSIFNGFYFATFTGKHLCQSLIFNKVENLRIVTLLKSSLCHKRFPVNFAKFLRTAFLAENLQMYASEILFFIDLQPYHHC